MIFAPPLHDEADRLTADATHDDEAFLYWDAADGDDACLYGDEDDDEACLYGDEDDDEACLYWDEDEDDDDEACLYWDEDEDDDDEACLHGDAADYEAFLRNLAHLVRRERRFDVLAGHVVDLLAEASSRAQDEVTRAEYRGDYHDWLLFSKMATDIDAPLAAIGYKPGTEWQRSCSGRQVLARLAPLIDRAIEAPYREEDPEAFEDVIGREALLAVLRMAIACPPPDLTVEELAARVRLEQNLRLLDRLRDVPPTGRRVWLVSAIVLATGPPGGLVTLSPHVTNGPPPAWAGIAA